MASVPEIKKVRERPDPVHLQTFTHIELRRLLYDQLAMIGCGSMGGGMALRFAEQGISVRNRTNHLRLH